MSIRAALATPSAMIAAFFAHMVPHRLAVLGVFASAVHPQFEGIMHDDSALKALHTLMLDTPPAFIAMGVEILRMGMRDVLGVIGHDAPYTLHVDARFRVHPFFLREDADYEGDVARMLRDPATRALFRRFFCSSVLDFQERILRREPECLSAFARVLVHGAYVRMLRTLPKTEAIDICRNCFTFSGFTLYQLFMRADAAVTGLSMFSEQVAWECDVAARVGATNHLQRLRARMPVFRSPMRLRHLIRQEEDDLNLLALHALLAPLHRPPPPSEEAEAPPFQLCLLTELAAK